jgi:hypothetical protein
MMIADCKECIHEDVCYYREYFTDAQTKLIGADCGGIEHNTQGVIKVKVVCEKFMPTTLCMDGPTPRYDSGHSIAGGPMLKEELGQANGGIPPNDSDPQMSGDPIKHILQEYLQEYSVCDGEKGQK